MGMSCEVFLSLFRLRFFVKDTASTEIYTLSLHDALPISRLRAAIEPSDMLARIGGDEFAIVQTARSEEHTSELQSPVHLVCRLLLEKKNIYDKRPESHLRFQKLVLNYIYVQ